MPGGVPPVTTPPPWSAAIIAAIAAKAGFVGHGLDLAVAVAIAESGGDPSRTSPPNSDQWHSRDRGLWQLNSHWHAEVSDRCAYTASCAARSAFRISNGGSNFGAWSTFKNGAAQQQLGAASDGVKAMRDGGGPSAYLRAKGVNPDALWHGGGGFDVPGAGIVGDVAGAVTAPLAWGEALASFLGKLSDPSTWLRVVEVVGGVALMGGGILIVARSIAGDNVNIPTPALAASAARSRPASSAGGASTRAAGQGATATARGASAAAAETAAV